MKHPDKIGDKKQGVLRVHEMLKMVSRGFTRISHSKVTHENAIQENHGEKARTGSNGMCEQNNEELQAPSRWCRVLLATCRIQPSHHTMGLNGHLGEEIMTESQRRLSLYA